MIFKRYCPFCKVMTDHKGYFCLVCRNLDIDIGLKPLEEKQAIDVIPKVNLDVHIEQKPVPIISVPQFESVGFFKKLWYLYLNKSVSYIPLVMKVVSIFVPQVNAINIIYEQISQNNKPQQIERLNSMDWNSLKTFLVPFIARWILKVGAGVIGTLGISSGSALEVISAVLMFLVGIIISLVNHNTAINTFPPTE